MPRIERGGSRDSGRAHGFEHSGPVLATGRHHAGDDKPGSCIAHSSTLCGTSPGLVVIHRQDEGRRCFREQKLVRSPCAKARPARNFLKNRKGQGRLEPFGKRQHRRYRTIPCPGAAPGAAEHDFQAVVTGAGIEQDALNCGQPSSSRTASNNAG